MLYKEIIGSGHRIAIIGVTKIFVTGSNLQQILISGNKKGNCGKIIEK